MFLFSSSPLSLEDVLKATKRHCMGSAPRAKLSEQESLTESCLFTTTSAHHQLHKDLFFWFQKVFPVFSVNLTSLADKSGTALLTLLAASSLWTHSGSGSPGTNPDRAVEGCTLRKADEEISQPISI